MPILNIYFSGKITEDSVNKLFTAIEDNIVKGGVDVNLVLSTSGGEVLPAIDFYYKIKNKNFCSEVTVYNPSMIGSAGTILYLAFSKRVVLPSTLFMVHSVAVSNANTATHSVALLNEMVGEIFEEKTIMTKTDYIDLVNNNREKYYIDTEVIAMGISNNQLTMIPKSNIYFGI